MPLELNYIKGITTSAEKNLRAAGIDDVDKLRNALKTAEQRKDLAKKISQPDEELYIWSKQVELMQIDGISADLAQLMIQCGIRNISDLVSANTEKLLKFMKTVSANTPGSSQLPTAEEIGSWKKIGESIVSAFQNDAVDEKNEFLFENPVLTERKNDLGSAGYTGRTGSVSSGDIVSTSLRETGFFSDLAQVITQIGAGVAEAQHQMDLSSLEIQNMILEDAELAASGFNATWYTIPEVNCTLKMEYAMMEETTTTKNGSLSGVRKMFISPSNARYNNIFKSSQSGESVLNMRIVPVPAPERFTERLIMPNLLGMTREAAEEELARYGIAAKAIQIIKGKTKNGQATEITYQSIPADKVLVFNEQPELQVTVG